MEKFIDLSHNLEHNSPVYPGDDNVTIKQNKYLENDQYNNFILQSGMHVGTHIDSPMHMINSDLFINDYPLNQFIGNGFIINALGEKVIYYRECYQYLINKDDIVLIYTGFDQHYGTSEYYYEHPVITEKLAQFFIDKGVKIIGIDTPSPDRYPFNIHKMLFSNNIFIIENMTNLDKLINVNKFEVLAIPLKIKADSSLLRVIARVL